jgi:hypothetical protein
MQLTAMDRTGENQPYPKGPYLFPFEKVWVQGRVVPALLVRVLMIPQIND